MKKVLEQNWNAPLTRLLIHIADASDLFWYNHKSEGKRVIHKLLKKMRCQTKIFNYIFIKATGTITEEFIKDLRVGCVGVDMFAL